jgi:hypothetical protein
MGDPADVESRHPRIRPAPSLSLTAEDLAEIERAVPRGAAAGPRYAAQQMAALDSERSRTTAG